MADSIRRHDRRQYAGHVLYGGRDFAGADHPPRSISMLRVVLSCLVKDRRRILIAMSSVIALAFLLALMIKPVFVADSTLLVLLSPDYAPRMAGDESKPAASIVVDRDAILKDEVEILNSASLAKETLRKVGLDRVYPDLLKPPGLRAQISQSIGDGIRALFALAGAPKAPARAIDPLDLAAGSFSKDMTATADKAGNIIVVTFRHRDSVVAADVVNTQINDYFAKRAELLRDEQSALVARQADALRKELDRVSRAYSEFKNENDISDFSNQRLLLLRQQSELARDLQAAERAIAQSTQRLAVLRKELDAQPSDNGPYRNQIRTRPVVLDTLQVDRNRSQQELDASKARRDIDTTQLAQVDAQIRALSQKEFELERLDGQRKLVSDNFGRVMKALDTRMFEEDVMAKKTANVRVIQAAEIPVTPNNLRLVIIAGGVALGLFAGLATAFLSELFRRGYLRPETLEHHVRVPVLVSVPLLPNPPQPIAAPVPFRPDIAPASDFSARRNVS
ncbi:GumC family protein [Methylocapsa palsarum]|uniref:Uncharacterized protein involved in exopolysaccharide biosynthesis n=1 Tax=Methylocapsa palsarum TaxID=1612308 RepID=A0A1I4CP60_9HYPH|nr:hypothetical protein [Methylocapsa palsarum]SFK81751.1 Uncharacterized protein involved in exopolysaccharide biosynthesis [Methylocapsa palsarum]